MCVPKPRMVVLAAAPTSLHSLVTGYMVTGYMVIGRFGLPMTKPL
ncbi:hypothetical protein [Allorhodopirellula heiligendammensis]|nr:hypothetical protein [Allorhodopirellula heiligendammensis]